MAADRYREKLLVARAGLLLGHTGAKAMLVATQARGACRGGTCAESISVARGLRRRRAAIGTRAAAGATVAGDHPMNRWQLRPDDDGEIRATIRTHAVPVPSARATQTFELPSPSMLRGNAQSRWSPSSHSA